MQNIEWRPIKNFEGLYEVSNTGLIKSLHCGKEKILKQVIRSNNYPYYFIGLLKNRERKYFAVHRLVAETFIDNPYNYNEVNHIDENKQNNNIKNLEWCNHKYNINYGIRGKQVIQYDLKGNIIREWNSASEVEKELGIAQTSICSCRSGRLKTAGGYIWKYKKQ